MVAETRLGTDSLPGEGEQYLADGICSQLWSEPQINFDGELLGCCQNVWARFGENVLAVGLPHALAGETLRYAKDMLQGKAPPRDDVPCTACPIYVARLRTSRWLRPPLPEPGLRGFLRRRGLGRLLVWAVNRREQWLSRAQT
jgi:hypothetical protein